MGRRISCEAHRHLSDGPVMDDDLRRHDALRRLRAPAPIKAERFVPEPSYIEGEEIYVPPSWRCGDCDTRLPLPTRLAIRGSAVQTARRIVSMKQMWNDFCEVTRLSCPEFVERRRLGFFAPPALCVWCYPLSACGAWSATGSRGSTCR